MVNVRYIKLLSLACSWGRKGFRTVFVSFFLFFLFGGLCELIAREIVRRKRREQAKQQDPAPRRVTPGDSFRGKMLTLCQTEITVLLCVLTRQPGHSLGKIKNTNSDQQLFLLVLSVLSLNPDVHIDSQKYCNENFIPHCLKNHNFIKVQRFLSKMHLVPQNVLS